MPGRDHQAARHLGDRRGQASALGELGVVWRMTGDYLAAAQLLEQALSIYRDLRDRGGEAETLNETGTLHRVSSDLAQAGNITSTPWGWPALSPAPGTR